MSDSKSSNDAKGRKEAKAKKPSERLLMTQESADDEYEIDLIDEDEQHKTPLIKDGGKSGKKPKLTLNLNTSEAAGKGVNKKAMAGGKRTKVAEEEDEEEDEEVSETTRFKSPLNTPPPITIGKIKIFNPGRRRRMLRLRRFLKKCCILVCAFLFLLLLLYNINRLPEFINDALGWLDKSTHQAGSTRKDASSNCNRVVSTPVWKQNFPMLTIESALRMVDVNNDTVLDAIVPFGTGLDAAYYDQTLCQIYFNQTEAQSKTIGCGGGVMAIDGANGQLIWSQYTPHEMFATNCNIDINVDGVKDCIIAGRMASLYAFDGRTGTILWSINSNYGDPIAETSNFYTPLLIPKDVDGDSISDIIVMHGGDPLRKPGERVRNVARLMVISSKTGQILTWSYVPDNSESYYSPQLLVHPDGTLLVLFGTGGETHPGGLYVVALDALLSGHLKHNYRAIMQDCCKGFITPPVLADINEDGIVDIIMSHFNSTVFAIDGFTFETLWKREFVGGETYSSPSVGYFNSDNVPDFGVTYQFGPGFPIYYYAEFHVLNGRNGESLLKKPVRFPIGTQSSPLTVSTFAQNDIFLFWYSSCSNSTATTNQTKELTDSGPYQISPGATVHESSRADFCRLRFGDQAQHYTQYRAITFDSSTSIYDSRTDEPIVKLQNATQMAYRWYSDKVSQMAANGAVDDEGGRAPIWGPAEQNLFGLNGNGQAIKDEKVLYSSDAYEQLKKYKKWPMNPSNFGDGQFDTGNLLYLNEQRQRVGQDQDRNRNLKRKRRYLMANREKRHVGLHNGDSVQRVISTGTLAPSLASDNAKEQLPVDGSIDVIFATYSFPPSSNVKLMSAAMRKCIQTYLAPEKEAELRLMDDNSVFKRLGYDHDAYEAAVKELCLKETGEAAAQESDQGQQAKSEVDPVKANDWIRPMGSMTVHRVNLQCFDRQKNEKQIAIKEYFQQWWPSYLGILGDAVANLLDG